MIMVAVSVVTKRRKNRRFFASVADIGVSSMSSLEVVITIGAKPPARLDKALARDVPEADALSRSRIARLIGEGAVARGGDIIADQKARVREGEVYVVRVPAPVESHLVAEDIPLEVIWEDDDLVVVNKSAGMVVHPAPGTPGGTLVNALLHHFGGRLSGVGGAKRPGIVHRIDKDTSGLLVVAKSDAAHHGLAAQFEKHTVERKYSALVYGVPDASDPRLRGVRGVNFEPGNIMKITTHLARHKTDRQKQAVLFGGARHAVTRVRTVASFGDPAVIAQVECWLETGRTHQIRVHMAHVGHGLIGDPTYGGRRKVNTKALGGVALAAVADFPRQALHAAVLGFVHPVSGEALRFEAELPADLANLRSLLGG
jgi:23S rRNA pseudouridine1911/1915/1917 synthase